MSASSNSQADEGAGENAVEPRCGHFGQCGGCRLQDVGYEGQLRKKAGVLQELLSKIEWLDPVVMHPSPDIWFYRNKMEFSFQDIFPVPEGEGADYLLLGQKVRNRWDKVMNLDECFLMSEEVPALLKSVHAWALREKLEPYNLHKRRGFLRHLVVREAKNTGERLVNLVTTEGKIPEESFIKAVTTAYPATTVLHGIHGGKADVAVAEETRTLQGPGFITEEFLGKRFKVSPYSFAQTNTHGAEFLYQMLRDWIGDSKPATMLDLCCGTGGITLCVADLCGHVMGVELIEAAVADAQKNAEANGITNVTFMPAKAEDLLPGLVAQKLEVDAAIVDPPRCGLHPKATAALKELGPGTIYYVSCNPKALIEDIKRLSELYDLRRIEGVDLFPHTDHMECLALLQRIY